MLELLVASLCIGNYSCDKATHAYYQSNLVLQKNLKKHEKRATRYVPEALLYSAPAIAAVATHNRKTLHLYGPVYLGLGKEETMILFKRSF